ncbi:MAG: hypothetical protein K2P73_13160 [Lachnospiraceae bacterium]|nr:hypothetical protein [Lachnospiraceae bacterium]
MPKEDTILIQLSEKVHITVEEIKNLGVENLDHMFLKIYTKQAGQLTESRQQKKVTHPISVVVEIVFFAGCFKSIMLNAIDELSKY